MAKRLGKRTLTFISTIFGLSVIVLLFLPSLLDDNADWSLKSLKTLFSDEEQSDRLELDSEASAAIKARGWQPSRARRNAHSKSTPGKDKASVNARPAADQRDPSTPSRTGRPISSPATNRGANRTPRGSFVQGSKTQKSTRRLRASPRTSGASRLSSPANNSPESEEKSGAEDSEDEEEDEDEDKPELGATVTTAISGKLMKYQTRKGVAGASVQVLVFHPLSTVPGGPQWVVPSAATTGGDGTFSLNVEIPERPAAGAVLGLIFSHSDEVPVAGVPISALVPGRATNLGVFWLGGSPLTLQGTVSPSSVAASSSVIDTGGLNPLAWDPRIRGSILALFPKYTIEQGEFNVAIGAQEADYENQRWMSLVTEGQWLGSQSVKFSQVDVERNGQTKKELIARVNFILGPDTSARGNVSSKNGGALPGAVVTALTTGAEAQQIQITGPNGDFRFEKPPSSLRAFRVEHSDYLTEEYPYDPRAASPQLELTTRRPNIPITLTDSVNSDPVGTVNVTLVGVGAPGKTAPSQELTLSSPTGQYNLTASFAIARVLFRSEGYFQGELATPNNNPEGALEVTLTPARVVTQTAREAKERSGANNRPSHGIYWWEHETQSLLAYSQNNWLEFEIDFGAELAAFDFELGARNFRIIDHKYHFQVQVDFEGMDSKRLSILAHQTETKSARVSLPPKKGVQRVRITWLNDRYIPGQLDANIIVDWVKFHQRPLTPEESSSGQ